MTASEPFRATSAPELGMFSGRVSMSRSAARRISPETARTAPAATVAVDGVPPRGQLTADLRKRIKAAREPRRNQLVVPTGLSELDRQLPGGGLPTAAVIEWISDHPGQKTVSTALACLRPMLDRPGCLTVIDPDHDFNADALNWCGIPMSRLLLIRPPRTRSSQSSHSSGLSTSAGRQSASDTLWALEQSARCPGVRIVLCRLTRVSATIMRRLQLAVERSGVTVVLIRPRAALRQASFADLRIILSAEKLRVVVAE